MDHQQIVTELKGALDKRFDKVDLELTRHDSKLDLFLERITRLEVRVENNSAKINWFYGILAASITSLVAYVASTVT